MILDGDCRTDRRYLEIRASSYAERAQLNWGSEVTVCLRSLLSQRLVPGRPALC